MPSINMIAPRLANRRRTERDIRRMVAVVVAEIVVAVLCFGWVATKYFSTRSQIADLDVKLAKLAPVIKQIKSYDQSAAEIKPKVELLQTAQRQTLSWYDTFDRLTQSMPVSTYLSRVSSSIDASGGKGITVVLGGVSSEQSKIGEAMLRLYSVPTFENVELHYTQEQASRGGGVDFEVAATMKGSVSKKGATKDGSSES